jgi:methylphosphonate synthase
MVEAFGNSRGLELERKRIGSNFLGILNDLKRRPEDAAEELGVSLVEINSIIEGKQELPFDLVSKAIRIWPVNARDFFIVRDDCETGIKIMTATESKDSSRIMQRAGKPYYEYRDTAMSSVAPFRPEWIMELCVVDDNDPNNKSVQWNNGHFMHQFTYFIGEVNFYYMSSTGEKKVGLMNTGDSVYITPFVPHTFATRKGASKNGLILALTYGNKLTGEVQQELSSVSPILSKEYVLDFSNKNKAFGSLLSFHRHNANITISDLATRAKIPKEKIENFENGSSSPSFEEINKFALALRVNSRELFPNDLIENNVILQKYTEGEKWFFPESTKSYEFIELSTSSNLPYSKAFEINVLDSNGDEFDLKVGLHQYVYNLGDKDIQLNWIFDGEKYQKILQPNDSAYIKPFVEHNFRGEGKLLVLRVGGKSTGDAQIELSFVGKRNVERAINEMMLWFDPTGKN